MQIPKLHYLLLTLIVPLFVACGGGTSSDTSSSTNANTVANLSHNENDSTDHSEEEEENTKTYKLKIKDVKPTAIFNVTCENGYTKTKESREDKDEVKFKLPRYTDCSIDVSYDNCVQTTSVNLRDDLKIYFSDMIDNCTQTPTPIPTPMNGNYMLTAWNDLGMHCMDGNDFSVFSVLPPFNNLHAQLKDKNGGLITSGVTVTYESIVGTDGKWNTSSSDKTNFWVYSQKLLGATLEPDTGLTGVKTPSKTPQPMTFNAEHQWWEAEGIPITPYNDDGSKNYYPLVKVVAKDSTGKIIAEAKTVLPVSDEMDCKRCHSSIVDSPAAKPKAGWVNHTDLEKDYKYNILRLHDESHPNAVSAFVDALKTKGYDYNISGLEATALSGTPIQCAACHKTNALPGVGIGIKAFTNAIHSKHANVIDPDNGMRLSDSNNRNACYTCHPGAQTECLRGAMGDAKNADGSSQMQCQSCHGDMHAVGDKNREGWFDEPNCQACHHDGMQETSAIDPATNTLRHVIDTRFATNMNTPATGISLYRFSTGHGNLQCEACHGATHAIYPAHNADNLLSEGVQGHAGTIGECSSCHASVPNTTTGGPHGMHPVGQSWVKDHEDAAENNPAQCKACHGQDYRGSALSKMWVTRTLDGKTFPKGKQVSCFDCHNGPSGE